MIRNKTMAILVVKAMFYCAIAVTLVIDRVAATTTTEATTAGIVKPTEVTTSVTTDPSIQTSTEDISSTVSQTEAPTTTTSTTTPKPEQQQPDSAAIFSIRTIDFSKKKETVTPEPVNTCFSNDMCQSMPGICHRGTCITKTCSSDIICSCDQGFTGQFCDRNITEVEKVDVRIVNGKIVSTPPTTAKPKKQHVNGRVEPVLSKADKTANNSDLVDNINGTNFADLENLLGENATQEYFNAMSSSGNKTSVNDLGNMTDIFSNNTLPVSFNDSVSLNENATENNQQPSGLNTDNMDVQTEVNINGVGSASGKSLDSQAGEIKSKQDYSVINNANKGTENVDTSIPGSASNIETRKAASSTKTLNGNSNSVNQNGNKNDNTVGSSTANKHGAPRKTRVSNSIVKSSARNKANDKSSVGEKVPNGNVVRNKSKDQQRSTSSNNKPADFQARLKSGPRPLKSAASNKQQSSRQNNSPKSKVARAQINNAGQPGQKQTSVPKEGEKKQKTSQTHGNKIMTNIDITLPPEMHATVEGSVNKVLEKASVLGSKDSVTDTTTPKATTDSIEKAKNVILSQNSATVDISTDVVTGHALFDNKEVMITIEKTKDVVEPSNAQGNRVADQVVEKPPGRDGQKTTQPSNFREFSVNKENIQNMFEGLNAGTTVPVDNDLKAASNNVNSAKPNSDTTRTEVNAKQSETNKPKVVKSSNRTEINPLQQLLNIIGSREFVDHVSAVKIEIITKTNTTAEKHTISNKDNTNNINVEVPEQSSSNLGELKVAVKPQSTAP